MQTAEYKGWPNNLKLSNGEVELIVTLDVGPRVISYRRLDGANVLKQYDEQLGQSGEDEWMIRGGHRLWVSPEDPGRTYVLDNAPVEHVLIAPGHVRMIPPPETGYDLQKELELKLDPSGSGVTVVHRVRNTGDEPTELAIWALTVMAPGGVEVIPLPPKRPHPGGPETATAEAYAPSTSMTLWSYFDFTDPRWSFGSKAILLRQDPERGPTKIGLAHTMGAVGYLNNSTLFIKRFGFEPDQTYPDFHSNYETFTNEDMLELESLSPLVRLAPGDIVEHTERWELVPNVPEGNTEAELVETVLPLLLPG